MKRVIRIALMVLVALAVMVPAHAATTVTVGEFLTQIAHVKNLPAQDGTTAAASLKAAGVNVPAADLTAPLTEGTVAQVANSLGLSVTTSNPKAPFSQAQTDAFISTFGQMIKAPNQTVQPNVPTQPPPNSKGKKKGFTKSRHEPV